MESDRFECRTVIHRLPMTNIIITIQRVEIRLGTQP